MMSRLFMDAAVFFVVFVSMTATAQAQHRVEFERNTPTFVTPVNDTAVCLNGDRVLPCNEKSQITFVKKRYLARTTTITHDGKRCLYSNPDGRFALGNCSDERGDQLWRFEFTAIDGQYRIRNQVSKKCLAWGGKENPTKLLAVHCGSGTNELWQLFRRPKFDEREPFLLTSSATSKCLDVDERTKAIQHPCSASANHFIARVSYSPVGAYTIEHSESDRCLLPMASKAVYGDCVSGRRSGWRMFPGKRGSVLLKTFDLKQCLHMDKDGNVYSATHCPAEGRENQLHIKPFYEPDLVEARPAIPHRDEWVRLATRSVTRGDCIGVNDGLNGELSITQVKRCTYSNGFKVIQSPMSGFANIIQLEHDKVGKCLNHFETEGMPNAMTCDAEAKGQAWIVSPVHTGGFQLENLESGMCLAMTNDGLSLATCDASSLDQRWFVMKQNVTAP